MSYSVKIRKNETGEIRLYKMEGYEWDNSQLFWWKEGNASCDCNRVMDFNRAGNEPLEDVECEYSLANQKYHVLCAVLEDGTEVKIDALPEQE